MVSNGPAAAQDSSGAQQKAEVDPGDRLIGEFYEHLYAGRYREALDVAKRFKPDKDNRPGQAVAYVMRSTALYALKRDREANGLMKRAYQLVPQEASPARILFFGAVVVQRFDIAADSLDRLLAGFPAEVRDIDKEMMNYFLRNQPEGQDKRNEDRRIAIARIGYGGDAGDYYASAAVDILLKRGDLAGAALLLSNIDEPTLIENMLIQKRYSALWPRVADIAGPHLSKVRESSVSTAERDYLAGPENHEALQIYANALRHAGRLDDAIALRERLPRTVADMSNADEDMGWAVNNVAIALHEAGQGEEADRLFARLNDATIAEGGWRVSMIINRLEMLVNDGKFERAVPLLDAAQVSAGSDGSPYAQQLVRRLRFCTMSGLGRKADAAKARPELLAHAGDAYHATVDALLCAGELDEAERVALTALKDPDEQKRSSFEEDLVRTLQPIPLTSDDPSKWQGRWAELRRRPAIAREYERLGRDMPADLVPPKSPARPAANQ